MWIWEWDIDYDYHCDVPIIINKYYISQGGGGGVTPNITANAVSVPSTNPANVIQSGTSENPIFTFEIPRGADGISGVDGKDGIDGKDGLNGADGTNGKSAYELALEHGFVGTEQEYLDSLVGEKGEAGERGLQGEKGNTGDSGSDGIDGKSAYELAVEKGYSGTLDEWLESIKGERGEQGLSGSDGENGKSAYEIAVEQGYSGSEIEWIASLKGERGEIGPIGPAGENGPQGPQGERGKDALTPVVHHCNLSLVNSEYVFGFSPTLGYTKVSIRLQRTNTTTIQAAMKTSVSGNVIPVDAKRITQYGLVGVEGWTLDDSRVTGGWSVIDTLIYSDSTEMQKIFIRTNDPDNTALWSLYEIGILCSKGGARTDIWVMPIYELQPTNWV